MDPQTSVSESTSLLSMPVEILLQIASNLTTPELGNLRCVCKQIETTLFTSFSREFFTKRQFMFTEFSLQALADISKSRLSSCLRQVIFSLQRPPPVTVNVSRQNSPDWQDRARLNRWFDERVSHVALINTHQDVAILVEVFGNLSNLETVGLRDFDSYSRHRDAPFNAWKSYGARTFELDTGTSLVLPGRLYLLPSHSASDDTYYLDHVFLTILQALGKARSQLPHLEVILRKSSLRDEAFYMSKFLEPIVDPLLANLRTLFLDLSSDSPSYQVNEDGEPTQCSSYLLRKFLSKVHGLERLRLNFRTYDLKASSEFLMWLSQPLPLAYHVPTLGSVLPHSPPPADFTKLRELDIGMTAVKPAILVALIRKYGTTLRAISFHKISLLEPPFDGPENRVNLWTTFFDEVSKLDLRISDINLQFLSQSEFGAPPVRRVTFTDSANPHVRRWAGSDMQSGLRDFISHTSVEGLKDKNISSESSGSDSEDTDMDDVDDEDGDSDLDDD